MNQNHIQKYIDFVNKSSHNFHHTLVFLPVDNIYYLFYDEKNGINANELNIKFDYDGIYKHDQNIYYYVGFERNKFDHFVSLLCRYNIVILNEEYLITDFYQKKIETPKSMLSFYRHRSTFNHNIGIIQCMYTMYGHCLPSYINIDGEIVNIRKKTDEEKHEKEPEKKDFDNELKSKEIESKEIESKEMESREIESKEMENNISPDNEVKSEWSKINFGSYDHLSDSEDSDDFHHFFKKEEYNVLDEYEIVE